MTLEGKQYNKKEMAGKTILEICKTKENSELEEIGKYRGMRLELQINIARQEFELFLKGNSEYKISLGNDIFGNITRMDNALSNIGKELEESKEQLKGNYILSLESINSKMLAHGEAMLLNNKLKKEDEIIEHINAVNMEQVKDIINKVFNIENLAVCIVGKDVEGVQI